MRKGGGRSYTIGGFARAMCRMMGVVSQGPVYYDLFEEFADLATQGMCPLGAPDERGHRDGWGLACFQDGVTWAFQHNGSLVNDPNEEGMIDSMILFRFLLDSLPGREHEDVAKATAATRNMAIEKFGGFTSLNFVLTDG